MEFSNTLVHFQYKVKCQNDDNLSDTAADIKNCINHNLLNTLFDLLSIQINGREIEHEPNDAHKPFLLN